MWVYSLLPPSPSRKIFLPYFNCNIFINVKLIERKAHIYIKKKEEWSLSSIIEFYFNYFLLWMKIQLISHLNGIIDKIRDILVFNELFFSSVSDWHMNARKEKQYGIFSPLVCSFVRRMPVFFSGIVDLSFSSIKLSGIERQTQHFYLIKQNIYFSSIIMARSMAEFLVLH